MEGSRIRTTNMIISNSGGKRTSQIRIKGNIQHRDLDQLGACWVRVKAIIISRVRDSSSHFVNNRNNKCHLKKILPQWKIE
ncbi:hypothetical protein CR513_40668, partial [Mucuna pruriens]